MALKTDYKDYIPPSGGRKYKITANSDGSSSVEDITQYQQVGDTWGAEDINQVNKLVNGAVYRNKHQLSESCKSTRCNIIHRRRHIAILHRQVAYFKWHYLHGRYVHTFRCHLRKPCMWYVAIK